MFVINPPVPELICSDLARSLGFYVECLGFEVVQRRGNEGHAYLALHMPSTESVPGWWTATKIFQASASRTIVRHHGCATNPGSNGTHNG
jgi:catechol 2,3-dioxygenase-like lactoylglutathione lyase family enzyme